MSRQRPKIAYGHRVGDLTVMTDTGERKNGYIIWQCHCDCGGTIRLDTRALQRGCITDCGCKRNVMPGQKDLTGLRFGRLTALEPVPERGKNGSTIWRCSCDCGGETRAVATQLLQGYKKSCGCLSHPARKAYIGVRFGKLVVTGYAGKRKGMHRWHCLCDCGNTTVVGQTLLQSGKTKSCGCLKGTKIAEKMKYVDGTSVTLLERAGNRLNRSNTSGYNGVHYDRRSGKWIAKIGFKRVNYYLGSYPDIRDAVAARGTAEKHIYGEFLKWYYGTFRQEEQRKREAAGGETGYALWPPSK